MSSRPESGNDAAGSRPASPDDLLPAVQAPSAGFILQLFFIPLVIVSLIVAIWFLFSWLASAGSDPKDLVRDLKKLNDARWQKAVSLAEQLRNPANDHLKSDAGLCSELAGILDTELESDRTAAPHLKLRIFLCRALGEFRVETAADVLVKAATTPKSLDELEVQAAALEALAVLAHNVGPEKLRAHDKLLPTVLEASRDTALDSEQNHAHAEIRSRAAFTLAVLGGPEALERLEELLSDAYSNTRYNAAIGFCRHGDTRGEKILMEMLDPTNTVGLRDEKSESEQKLKRISVMLNAIRAVDELVAQHAADKVLPEDVVRLQDTVRQLQGRPETPPQVKRVVDELIKHWPPKPTS